MQKRSASYPGRFTFGQRAATGWAPGPVWTPGTDRITIPRSLSLVIILDPVRFVAYNKYISFDVVYVTVLDSVCRFPLRFVFCAEMLPAIIVHLVLRR